MAAVAALQLFKFHRFEQFVTSFMSPGPEVLCGEKYAALVKFYVKFYSVCNVKEQYGDHVRFEVLSAVTVKSTVFWVIALCGT
jgi:hypothetical protein